MRWTPLCVSLAASLVSAQAADDWSLRGSDSYPKQILPTLEKYCFDCHADGTKKGKFALDEHKDYASLRADMKHWDVVRQMLVTHVMPPVGKDSPTLPERDAMVQWIDDNIFSWPADQPDPGHVVIRRLNRAEYDNTIRDVFFLSDLKPSAEFPPDDSGYGFDNIGSVLSTSQMLMEKYLRASRRVVDAVLKVKPPVKSSVLVSGSSFGRGNKALSYTASGSVLWFHGNAESNSSFQVPAEGDYNLVLRVAATRAGPEMPKVRVKLDGEDKGVHEVVGLWRKDAQRTDWRKINIETRLSRGNHKLTVEFINEFKDPKAPEDKRERAVALDDAHVDGPFGLTQPAASKFMNWLLPNVSMGLPELNISGEDFASGAGPSTHDNGAIFMASSGYVKHPLAILEAGKYRFTLKAGAMQAGSEPAKWDVRLGDKVIQTGAVTTKDQAPQTLTFETELPTGKHELRVAFLNDFYDANTKADRNLWIHEMHIEGPLKARDTLEANDLAAAISKLGDRLFRRPMTEAEKTKWNGLAQLALKEGEPALGALGYAMEGMLSSPAFIFHGQPTPAGSRIGKTELIDERTLAERLAYFLWSAPPDDRLAQLVEKKELRKNLASEVKRMLNDWRARALTDNFAGQWLLLRDADLASPSTKIFKDFTGSLAYDMKRETENFFTHILAQNEDVIEFLNADYTFVNRRLAKYYNLPDADKIKTKDKNEFVKVSLAGTPRGGLLTQGSVLLITSNPTRTNIVRRGKFILENVLGIAPPPAPGNVAPLDEKKAVFGNQTLRQQFEQHRANQSCAGCHALLDPIGFAMENFDAIGRFREVDHRLPVDASGKWIRGQEFKDLSQLREIIVRDLHGDFVRCLTENLLTYSLGRGLEYTDRPAVKELVTKAEANGRKFQDLILSVCESLPFQRMRVE